jgi:hypothetical protein
MEVEGADFEWGWAGLTGRLGSRDDAMRKVDGVECARLGFALMWTSVSWF